MGGIKPVLVLFVGHRTRYVNHRQGHENIGLQESHEDVQSHEEGGDPHKSKALKNRW